MKSKQNEFQMISLGLFLLFNRSSYSVMSK